VTAVGGRRLDRCDIIVVVVVIIIIIIIPVIL